MHLILHMRVPFIFAPCGTITWGERGWAPHSINSLSPCDCATYANMRDSLICNMRCIYLIYIYIFTYAFISYLIGTQEGGSTAVTAYCGQSRRASWRGAFKHLRGRVHATETE